MDNANPNIQNQLDQAQQGNAFITTDMPDPEEGRKQLARKRIFYVLFALIVVTIGLLTWEIIDLAL